jgi:hypothetical protein
MSERMTIVIGARELLDSLRHRPEVTSVPVKVFARDDVKAFEAILTHPPAFVVLDQAFSHGARGSTLVERLKGDPAFRRTELLIIQGAEEAPPPPAARKGPQPELSPDARFTRKARRVLIEHGVNVQLDNTGVMLIDLSASGAQVISSTPLKPSQRVRFSLPGETSSRMIATVQWVAFELPKDKPAPVYRAGLEFANPDADAIEQFCSTHASQQSPA